jgi:ribonuclease P protein component
VLVLLAQDTESAGQPRGTVVAGRRVGPAVVRNRVKRRLRAALREALPSVPDGSLVVVRALPGAAEATYPTLAGWVRSGLIAAAPRERPIGAPSRTSTASHG